MANCLSDDVIQKYAPEVRFAEGENYYPADIEFYLGHVRMTITTDLIVLLDADGTPSVVTANNLTEFSYTDSEGKVSRSGDETGGEFRLKIKEDNGEGDLTRLGRPLVSYANGNETLRQVNTSKVPCYFRVNSSRKNVKIYDIAYSFFYPYNGGTAVDNYGAHQGDWEMIVVRLEEQSTNNYRVIAINYVAHGDNHWAYPSGAHPGADGYSLTSDTHPVVWCAKGSHASYSTKGTRTTGEGWGTDYVDDGGVRWQTWKNLVRLVDDETESNSVKWIGYRGRWGKKRDRTFYDEDGPRTPKFTSQWDTENSLTFWQIAGGLRQISAGSDGEIWGRNDDQQIYRYNASTGKWDHIDGKLTWVSVGDKNHIWGVNSDDLIYRYDRSTDNWEHISGKLRQVAVAFDGTVWGVNSDDLIYRYNAATGKWDHIDGKLRRIALSDCNNVWGANASGEIYRWFCDDFVKVSGSLRDVCLSKDCGIWGANDDGQVYRYAGDNKWTDTDNILQQITVTKNEIVWGVTSDGRIFRRMG